MALIDDLNNAVAAVVARVQADAQTLASDAVTIANLQAEVAAAPDAAQVQAAVVALQTALAPPA